MKGLHDAVSCKDSIIVDQCVSLLSKEHKTEEQRKLLSKNCNFLEQREETDRLSSEQRKLIASLSKEIEHVRRNNLTDFELSLRCKNGIIDK